MVPGVGEHGLPPLQNQLYVQFGSLVGLPKAPPVTVQPYFPSLACLTAPVCQGAQLHRKLLLHRPLQDLWVACYQRRGPSSCWQLCLMPVARHLILCSVAERVPATATR